MLYTLFAFLFAVVAVLVVHRAINLLLAASWFMGWLRGTVGLSLLAVAVAAGLLAYDIYSYKPIVADKPVATIDFEMIEPQYFTARVTVRNGAEQRFTLRGDQWQLDARIVRWEGPLATLDIKPAYRLDRLSGRFYNMQNESLASRTSYPLAQSILGLDLWQLLRNNDKFLSLVDTASGSPIYLPMKNAARFEIALSNKGLVISRPLNEAAETALAELH